MRRPALAHSCRFVSPARKLRLAVMEASISMMATLLPAIEPVDYVTVTPSAKSPIGRTVLKVGGIGVGAGAGVCIACPADCSRVPHQLILS